MPLKSKIRTIPHYPKEGILYRDITTLLKDPAAFQMTIHQLKERYFDKKIDLIVGIEARGFILGAALAYALKIGFVPIRKKGKLPGQTFSEDYELEYGADTIEIHKDAIKKDQKVVIIDDLLATGGTVIGAINLLSQCQANIVEATFLVNLPELGGAEKLKEKMIPAHYLVEFGGH